jgi:hypothetical protein
MFRSKESGDDNWIRAAYRDQFRSHGVHPRSLGSRPGSQEVRFAALVRDFGNALYAIRIHAEDQM